MTARHLALSLLAERNPMSDVNCPYCNAELEINHDDGYGYSDDDIFNQQCGCCEKYFIFTTAISFDYTAEQAPCLNGGEHVWKTGYSYPTKFTKCYCETCHESRQATDAEITAKLASLDATP